MEHINQFVVLAIHLVTAAASLAAALTALLSARHTRSNGHRIANIEAGLNGQQMILMEETRRAATAEALLQARRELKTS